MVKAIIDGMKFNSENGWTNIYADGHFRKTRGIDVYIKKIKEEIRCVVYHWTNFQGEQDTFKYLTQISEIIQTLQIQRHPERVNKAIEDLEELASKSLIEEL